MANPLALFRFEKRHNSALQINLHEPDAQTYLPMLQFIQRCRVRRALTLDHNVSLTYIGQFWSTAHIDNARDPTIIRATVAGHPVVLSRAILREVLELGSEDVNSGPREYPLSLRVGAFLRMGYQGNINSFPYLKANLYGQWRFLMHVLIQALAARKSAYDGMNARLASLMIGLVYNKPYDIAGFLYDECCAQLMLSADNRWLLYPRFIQAVINAQLGNLPVDAHQNAVAVMDKRIYRDCRPARRPRPDTPLFGAVLNATYLPPPHDGFHDVGAVVQAPPPVHAPPPPVQAPQAPIVPAAVIADQQDVLNDVFLAQDGQGEFDEHVGQQVVHQVLFGENLPQDNMEDIEHYSGSSSDSIFSSSSSSSDDEPVDEPAPSAEVSLGSDDTAEDDDAAGTDDDASDSDGEDPTMRYEVTRHTGQASASGKRLRDYDSDYQPSPSSPDSTALVPRSRSAKRVRTDLVVTTTVGESPTVPELSVAVSLPVSLPMLTVAIPSPGFVYATSLAMVPTSSTAPITLPIFTSVQALTVSPPISMPFSTPDVSPRFSTDPVLSTGGSVEFVSASPPVTSPISIAALPTIASLSARVDGLSAHVSTLEENLAAQTKLIAAQTKLIEQQSEMLKMLFAQGEKTAKCVDKISRVFRYDDRDDDAAQREQPPASHPTVSLAVATTQGEPTQARGEASGSGGNQGNQANLAAVDFSDDLFFGAGYDFDMSCIPGNQGHHAELDAMDFSTLDPTQGEALQTNFFDITGLDDMLDVPVSSAQVDIEKIRATVLDDTIQAESSEAETVLEPTNPVHREWFRKMPKPTVYKETINLENAKKMTTRIISWFWDDELKLFALKRLDGVQYLRCSIQVFSSLRISELKVLSRLPLINPNNNSRARYLESIVRREGGSGIFKQLQPSKPKYIKDPSGAKNPVSGRSLYEAVHQELLDEKKIPLKRLPQNILQDLAFWQLDAQTGEVVMYDLRYKEVLRLYDPLHLVNLSKDDLLVLSQSKLVVPEFMQAIGEKFANVVKTCIRKNVHADCVLFV